VLRLSMRGLGRRRLIRRCRRSALPVCLTGLPTGAVTTMMPDQLYRFSLSRAPILPVGRSFGGFFASFDA
jgi:hypothetical protein